MYMGLLTARFRDEKNLAEIASWASEAGFKGLEIHTRHLNPDDVLADDGVAAKKLMAENGLQISSLAHYTNFNKGNTPEKYTEEMKKVMQAAEVLGVEVVCTLAGFPAEGKDKMKTIREDVPEIFTPLAEEAQKRGLKIAFENWFMTNLQHLDHFKAITEALPQKNVGFNFDPSHLHWQDIDYIASVEEFKDRIFHIHVKDVAIRRDTLSRIGVLERGWWRYVIPGFGEIHWGRFLLALREIGYDGVLSVEHEDRAFNSEDGFTAALKHLSPMI